MKTEKAEISLEGVEGVLSDLDGTLRDSEEWFQQSREKVCRIVSGRYEDSISIPCFYKEGVPSKELYKDWINERHYLSPNYRAELYKEMCAHHDILKSKHFSEGGGGNKMFDDAQRFLQRLEEASIPTAIVTANYRIFVDSFLKDNNLSIPSVTADDVENTKPAPDLYLLAASKIGKNPEDCIALEDSLVGAQSAISAGVKTVIFRGTVPKDLKEHENVVGIGSFD